MRCQLEAATWTLLLMASNMILLEPALSSNHFSFTSSAKPFVWVLCEDYQPMSGLITLLLNWDTFGGLLLCF